MEWETDDVKPSPVAVNPSWRTLPNVAGAALLERNEVGGTDFGGFRDRLNAHFYPARVESLGHDHHLDAPVLAARQLIHQTIAYVRFGTSALVDPGDILGYHVNVPLRGTVLSLCGDQRVAASAPRHAAVFSPRTHTKLPFWDDDAAQLCIKLDRASVETELAGLLGRSVTQPVRFELGFDLWNPAGRQWLTVLSALLQQCADSSRFIKGNSMMELLERSLIAGLLMAQDHSYSEELRSDTPAMSSREVRRVIDVVEAAPETHYTLADLARLAHVSARTLQAAFQRDLGTTPTQYVRQVRLDRARDDLRLGRGLVSDVAYHWGFTNLGRFATLYNERFGELPSVTRSRS